MNSPRPYMAAGVTFESSEQLPEHAMLWNDARLILETIVARNVRTKLVIRFYGNNTVEIYKDQSVESLIPIEKIEDL